MKKNYQKPALEVVCFETEDIITTSGGSNGDPGGHAPDFPWGNEEDGWGSL